MFLSVKILLPVPQKVEWQSERFTALAVELTDILQRCFDPQPGLVTPAELFEALGPQVQQVHSKLGFYSKSKKIELNFYSIFA